MKRRALFGALGTTTLGVTAGCLSDDEGTDILATTFDTGVSDSRDFADDPTVEIEGDEVIVTGRYSTGGACYDAHLPEPTYDENDDELRIRVGRTHDGSDECDDLEEMVSYRLTVEFDGAPPGTVHVTEDMGGETTVESDSGWF